jgi:hypothetical protein
MIDDDDLFGTTVIVVVCGIMGDCTTDGVTGDVENGVFLLLFV